jgi:hypothetical protein
MSPGIRYRSTAESALNSDRNRGTYYAVVQTDRSSLVDGRFGSQGRNLCLRRNRGNAIWGRSKKRSNSAADFRAFYPLPQPEALIPRKRMAIRSPKDVPTIA